MYRIGDIELKQLEATIASKQLFRVGNPLSGRTAIINVSPDWDVQTVTNLIEACRKAVQ
jgi:hypothetical protein